ncbi:MAG: hypothetical protein LLF94_07565 [Chlamydiales bacterium]|nr:hypothetical protein [Chlamydiales bacterium]
MTEYPIISEFTSENLSSTLNRFQNIQLITTENRNDFSGEFPTHTRYFTNGDRPLVALVKESGMAKLWYGNKREEVVIPDHNFVFFDDSVPHSWHFKKCNLIIYYYRLIDDANPASTTGNYCLDNYFT